MSRSRTLLKLVRSLNEDRLPGQPFRGLRLLGLALLNLPLLSVSMTGIAGAQEPPPQHPEYLGETVLLPVTHKTVDLTLGNGFTYRGGDYGGQHDACSAPSRAFLELVDPANRSRWHRVRQHTFDQTPETGGLCADPAGQPLFEDFTTFNPAHILSSVVRDAATDNQTGEVFTLVDLMVAWMIEEEPGLAFARSAAILHWDTSGQLLSQRYLGRLPQGPPPAEGIDCLAVCDLFGSGHGNGAGDDYGGRRIVLDPQSVTITGWFHPGCQPSVPRPSREVLGARYSRDLRVQHWLLSSPSAGDGAGLALAAGELGQTLIAGFVQGADRDDRDVAVLRISAGGQIEELFSFGGAKDDEPESLEINADGTVTIGGFFTDQMIVGDLTVGGEGQGQQAFGVELDQDLQPISVWVVEASNPDPAGLAKGTKLPGDDLVPVQLRQAFSTIPAKNGDEGEGEDGHEVESHFGILEDYAVMHGKKVKGDLDQLIRADNDYLRIVDRAGEYVELRGFFDPDPMHRDALFIKEIGWELKTKFCYRARVFLRRHRLDQPDADVEPALAAGERRMCSSNARGRVLVAPELSVALGYDGVTQVDLNELLEVIFVFNFEEQDPQPIAGILFKDASDSSKDASVDQVEVEVEY